MSASVLELRGAPRGGGGPSRGGSRLPGGARPGERPPSLPVPAARGLAFMALAAFGVLHWMALLEPAAPGRALAALAIAGGVLVALLLAGRPPGRARHAAALAVAVAAVALAMLAGGVDSALLRPDRWVTLGNGISSGISSLPGVRVPYRGLDEWTRIVIPLGGTLLTVVCALAAFWPRRRGLGAPGLALTLLVGLYAVPAVALDFEGEFVRGAVLALLVVAFLRLEKLRVGDGGAAGVIAGGVAVLGLMLAPALDADQPWWDYETWALEAASAKSTAFTWDHGYGPLNWPRDGRELLRVRAPQAAYWKTENLDHFDGQRWSRSGSIGGLPLIPPDADPKLMNQWTQTIKVRVRNLRSDDFVTAGQGRDVSSPTVRDFIVGDGTYRSGRTLRRGDAYTAVVTVAAPNSRLRAAAPPPTDDDLAPWRRVDVPAGEVGQTGAPIFHVETAAFGDPAGEIRISRPDEGQDRPDLIDVLERGPYGEAWALAQRLRERADTQEELVDSVMSYLDTGFRYTEQPPPAARNLEGFLFTAKAGYCQHFSGAMALLLRMAGVPARVSTGFTSGSLDRKTREYVVRDLDAHSWVEVYYPTYGWVTFDPTPAAAPARSQLDDATSGTGEPRRQGAPRLGGDIPSDPGRRGAAPGEGTPWGWIALAAALGLLAGAALVLRVRRGRPAPLDELRRALARTRRDPGPGTTLSALESRFARTPAAAGYVRAVRAQRYGAAAGAPTPAAGAPTPAQRRGLRSELARGGGLLGRLRAWWALPPRAR